MLEGGRGTISRGMQEAHGLKKEKTKKIGIGYVSRGDNGDGVRASVYLRGVWGEVSVTCATPPRSSQLPVLYLLHRVIYDNCLC